MTKVFIIAVALMLFTSSASRAQSRFQKEFTSSDNTYSESKQLYSEGVKYALAGFFSQAVELFQRAIRLDPKFADAHFALGHAYFDIGRWKEAAESFQRAFELNPNDFEARDRLAQARVMLARDTKNQGSPSQKAEPTKNEPPRQPVAQRIGLSSKPAVQPLNPDANPIDPANTEEAPNNEANAAAKDLALTKLYRVGPGDVLDVRSNDSTSPQSTLFTVTPAGLLEHPLLAEPLHVGGKTVEEISTAMESDLKRRALLENPKVSVGVRDYASHTILVSGLVKDSGTKVLRREAIPLYVVIADAQPLPEAAKATVVRAESNETYEIDLNQPAEMHLLVRPGDVITLHANATEFLYIGGEVKSPGETTYRRGLTLTQAIISAGGVTKKGKVARLGRDDGRGFLTMTNFKLKDIEAGKIPDPLVRPGDRITIVD
ncbi:MAG TPA: tetratricopeptide repeat protein [Pyrinomonadaceae bacterium]